MSTQEMPAFQPENDVELYTELTQTIFDTYMEGSGAEERLTADDVVATDIVSETLIFEVGDEYCKVHVESPVATFKDTLKKAITAELKAKDVGGVDTKLKYMRNEFEIPMSPANPASKQYSMREIISKI